VVLLHSLVHLLKKFYCLRNIIFQLIVVSRYSLLIHFIVCYVLYSIDHILFRALKTVVPAGLYLIDVGIMPYDVTNVTLLILFFCFILRSLS